MRVLADKVEHSSGHLMWWWQILRRRAGVSSPCEAARMRAMTIDARTTLPSSNVWLFAIAFPCAPELTHQLAGPAITPLLPSRRCAPSMSMRSRTSCGRSSAPSEGHDGSACSDRRLMHIHCRRLRVAVRQLASCMSSADREW